MPSGFLGWEPKITTEEGLKKTIEYFKKHMNVTVITATYNEKGNIEKLISILEEEVFSKN